MDVSHAVLFNPGTIGMNAECYHAVFATFENEEAFQSAMRILIGRHVTGDWGNVDPEDKKTNDAALKTGARIISSYDVNGITVWIITESAQTDNPARREITTFLRPSDY